MGKVSVNITKKEYDFIDPNTGEQLSSQAFIQKYRAVGMGGLGSVLSSQEIETEKGENKEL